MCVCVYTRNFYIVFSTLYGCINFIFIYNLAGTPTPTAVSLRDLTFFTRVKSPPLLYSDVHYYRY